MVRRDCAHPGRDAVVILALVAEDGKSVGDLVQDGQGVTTSSDGQGTLAAGGRGDIILLDDDPLRSVGDTGDTAAVSKHLQAMHVAATLVAEGLVVHLKYEDVTTPYRVGTDTGHTPERPTVRSADEGRGARRRWSGRLLRRP